MVNLILVKHFHYYFDVQQTYNFLKIIHIAVVIKSDETVNVLIIWINKCSEAILQKET